VPHEDEQLVAGINDDGISQMATLGVGRLELEQTVELALKCARVRLHCAIGELGSAVANLAGTLQERLEWWGEYGIAGIDSVLRVTDQMGKADLMFVGMMALRRETI
jgi:hypothetical protein